LTCIYLQQPLAVTERKSEVVAMTQTETRPSTNWFQSSCHGFQASLEQLNVLILGAICHVVGLLASSGCAVGLLTLLILIYYYQFISRSFLYLDHNFKTKKKIRLFDERSFWFLGFVEGKKTERILLIIKREWEFYFLQILNTRVKLN
jgi:hypothetical protein